jgi:hypothetical protein
MAAAITSSLLDCPMVIGATDIPAPCRSPEAFSDRSQADLCTPAECEPPTANLIMIVSASGMPTGAEYSIISNTMRPIPGSRSCSPEFGPAARVAQARSARRAPRPLRPDGFGGLALDIHVKVVFSAFCSRSEAALERPWKLAMFPSPDGRWRRSKRP